MDTMVNDAIEIYVKDNLPLVKKKKGGQEKAVCEFCNGKHGSGEEFCDLKINGEDLNKIEGARKYKIQHIIDTMEHKRDLVFVVVYKDVNHPQYAHFRSKYVPFEEEKGESDDDHKGDINLDSCF